jgi:uncharacterized DUF497 family protein
MKIHFEWDAAKARANLRKHAVAFDAARSVFFDPLAAFFRDPDHSLEERREIAVGRSGRGRILFVFFTERDGNVRIISARTATKIELQDYEEGI